MAEQPVPTPDADRFADSARWAPRLRRILEDQAALYDALDRLSASQRALIDADDADGLLRLLADRQDALARLSESNDALTPFRTRWADLMERLPDDARTDFESRIDTLAEQVSTIAQRDEADQRALADRRSVATTQIAEVARGRSALNAYGGRRGVGPTYQDREG